MRYAILSFMLVATPAAGQVCAGVPMAGHHVAASGGAVFAEDVRRVAGAMAFRPAGGVFVTGEYTRGTTGDVTAHAAGGNVQWEARSYPASFCMGYHAARLWSDYTEAGLDLRARGWSRGVITRVGAELTSSLGIHGGLRYASVRSTVQDVGTPALTEFFGERVWSWEAGGFARRDRFYVGAGATRVFGRDNDVGLTISGGVTAGLWP